MPKKQGKNPGIKLRANPLLEQIDDDERRKYAQPRHHWKKQKKEDMADSSGDEDVDGGERENGRLVIPQKMSEKILKYAREQLVEESSLHLPMQKKRGGTSRTAAGVDGDVLEEGDEMDEDVEDDDADKSEIDEDENEYIEKDPYANLEISESDERILESLMAPSSQKRRTLGDIIMEKIKEKEAAQEGATQAAKSTLSPQMIEVYTSVGKLLSRYRSGKLPKALKLIPIMRNWEEVLYVTEPGNWTPHAMFAATRIFASNLNPRMAQRFYNLVLLPAVRDDMKTNKRLNYYYYMALKKALYKPAAFFKGVLLPLCDSGECTLREATIIASVLAKVSIPMMHSAAAMLKICSMPTYGGATSLFLRVLMDKKYSLPYRVIDALVSHFLSFHKEERTLPVLWHQSLLVFVQRYKTTITSEQNAALLRLLRQKNLFHHQMTPEIRRELTSSLSRDSTLSTLAMPAMEKMSKGVLNLSKKSKKGKGVSFMEMDD